VFIRAPTLVESLSAHLSIACSVSVITSKSFGILAFTTPSQRCSRTTTRCLLPALTVERRTDPTSANSDPRCRTSSLWLATPANVPIV
jgi:hypothetical protein